LNDTSPTPTKVIQSPEASIVATAGLLLLYVIAPVLLLVGRVVISKDASPNVLDDSTVNVDDADRLDIPRATVSVLLAFVAAAYWAVAACVALKLTSPAATNVIKFPEASMVATAVLLLLYVIAPLLLLVGRVVIANDASPNVLDDSTVNVDNTGTGLGGSTIAIPLELIPSPPYKVYAVPFTVAVDNFVYVLFVSRR